jgi:DNA-directed RNA polymerase specialized sigma24 family protein
MDPLELREFEAPAADQEAEDDFSVVQVELDRLPLLEREVLVLFYMCERSLNEIAAVSAIPVGTVKPALPRPADAAKTTRRQRTNSA